MTSQLKASAMLPIVSVVLPVFNGEKYLKESVNSILGQSFPGFELIVINDGSTDGTLRILEHFKELDKRVVLISRENRGLVETLNEGISVARGKWIARMDADDIAKPDRFERQLQWLEQTGADICGSWVKFFGAADKRILKHPQTDEAIKMELLFGSPFAHPTVMMKTELIKQLRYDKNWEKCEDYDLWERAARAGWNMTNIPEVLLLYRQHGAQISTSATTHQHFLAQKIRYRYGESIFNSMKLKKEWAVEILKLREPVLPKLNMDTVDAAFRELLQLRQGEARAVIFDHMTRLYYRAAADFPDIVGRWSKLNMRYGVNFAMGVKIKLWFLCVFHVHPNSRLFERVKKLYFYFIRSSGV